MRKEVLILPWSEYRFAQEEERWGSKLQMRIKNWLMCIWCLCKLTKKEARNFTLRFNNFSQVLEAKEAPRSLSEGAVCIGAASSVLVESIWQRRMIGDKGEQYQQSVHRVGNRLCSVIVPSRNRRREEAQEAHLAATSWYLLPQCVVVCILSCVGNSPVCSSLVCICVITLCGGV
jgi:hypothetical protein